MKRYILSHFINGNYSIIDKLKKFDSNIVEGNSEIEVLRNSPYKKFISFIEIDNPKADLKTIIYSIENLFDISILVKEINNFK